MQNFHDYRNQAFEQFPAFYQQEIEGKAPPAPVRLEIPESKEDLKYLFADIYALRYLPELLERKLGD